MKQFTGNIQVKLATFHPLDICTLIKIILHRKPNFFLYKTAKGGLKSPKINNRNGFNNLKQHFMEIGGQHRFTI